MVGLDKNVPNIIIRSSSQKNPNLNPSFCIAFSAIVYPIKVSMGTHFLPDASNNIGCGTSGPVPCHTSGSTHN